MILLQSSCDEDPSEELPNRRKIRTKTRKLAKPSDTQNVITVSAEVNDNTNKVSFGEKERTIDHKNSVCKMSVDKVSVDKMSQKVEPPPIASNEVSISPTTFL